MPLVTFVPPSGVVDAVAEVELRFTVLSMIVDKPTMIPPE
jgi:hypothetical protein